MLSIGSTNCVPYRAWSICSSASASAPARNCEACTAPGRKTLGIDCCLVLAAHQSTNGVGDRHVVVPSHRQSGVRLTPRDGRENPHTPFQTNAAHLLELPTMVGPPLVEHGG